MGTWRKSNYGAVYRDSSGTATGPSVGVVEGRPTNRFPASDSLNSRASLAGLLFRCSFIDFPFPVPVVNMKVVDGCLPGGSDK